MHVHYWLIIGFYSIVELGMVFPLVNSFQFGSSFVFSASSGLSNHIRTLNKHYCKGAVFGKQSAFPRSTGNKERFAVDDSGPLTKLRQSWKKQDCDSFSDSLIFFAQEVKSKRQQPTSTTVHSISLMIGELSDRFTACQIARVSRTMADIGYSFRYHNDYSLLEKLKKIFLSKIPSMEEGIRFLTALNKLQLCWKDEKEKDVILQLMEKISSEEMNGRQRSELIVAIVGIGIPWTSLSKICQLNIMSMMVKLNVETDSRSLRTFLYAFSSFEDLKIKEMSRLVSSWFLSLTQRCLLLGVSGNHENMDKARTVIDFRCFV
jgi:hypothetical protein